MILCDMQRIAAAQDSNLLLNFCNVVVAVLEVDLSSKQSLGREYFLDGDDIAGVLVDCFVDNPKGTMAHLFE